jgi:YHYH protein
MSNRNDTVTSVTSATAVAALALALLPSLATMAHAESTAGILCNYDVSIYNTSPSVKAKSASKWTCDSTSRILAANGLPDHNVGTFPNANNPNTISAQTVAATFTLTPSLSGTTTQTGGPLGAGGYILNGVKVDPSTAGTCTDNGVCDATGATGGGWNIEAMPPSSFDFGTDINNAHVQPDGAYHYHGMPEGFLALQKEPGGIKAVKNFFYRLQRFIKIQKNQGITNYPLILQRFLANQEKDTSMTLIGWASDGFPMYARYGYSDASNASSRLKVLTGSYQLKAAPDSGRPSVTTYAMGRFQQDWEYVAGSGDLDECNGRTGVTPEFPGGTYYYAITDSYPYIQRCVKGTVAGGGATPPPPAS